MLNFNPKLNAVKHGILSREAVIRRGDLREDEKEFMQLQAQLLEEVQPVGIVEVMLADKLLMSYWRHRRVIRAERALVETLTVDRRGLTHDIRSPQSGKSLADWQLLRRYMHTIEGAVDGNTIPFTHEELDILEHLKQFKEIEHLTGLVVFNHRVLLTRLQRTKTSKPTDTMIETLKTVTKKLGEEIDNIITELERNERESREASTEALAIGDDANLQRIQRYESFLSRSFTQGLHELQRAQNMRKGHDVPLSAPVDVTVESERDEFVS